MFTSELSQSESFLHLMVQEWQVLVLAWKMHVSWSCFRAIKCWSPNEKISRLESPLGAEWYSMLARHSGTVRFRLICTFETAVIVSFATPKFWPCRTISLVGSQQCRISRFFLRKKLARARHGFGLASHLPFSRYFSWVTTHDISITWGPSVGSLNASEGIYVDT